jgi:starch synthase
VVIAEDMKIAILTSGRFHVCDLARELDAEGHDVSFYSCVPDFRTRRFGLPRRCNKTLFWYLWPLFALMRKSQNTSLRPHAEHLLTLSLDTLASQLIAPCDVFIGMSGMSTRTANAIRRKYGARIWIERGSRHILSQQEILNGLREKDGQQSSISPHAIRRELADYELADTIVVPSIHVERSFIEQGTPPQKLFRNPYGVDLAMFPPTEKPLNTPPTVLFVGTWSRQKGCDLLWTACESSGFWRLLHVGPIGDAPVPKSELFIHRDPVPQWRLVEHFKQADVFALASRQEGLSLVQAQALACGLPVVCTDRTGGEDLRAALLDPRSVTVVPHDDALALQVAIEQALTTTAAQAGLRDILGVSRDALSWRAYGQRYSQELKRRL